MKKGILCPHCNEEQQAHTEIETMNEQGEEAQPAPADGDVNVCFYCGELSLFYLNGTKLRMMTVTDVKVLARDAPNTLQLALKAKKFIAFKQYDKVHRN